jgi:hypothetical protein
VGNPTHDPVPLVAVIGTLLVPVGDLPAGHRLEVDTDRAKAWVEADVWAPDRCPDCGAFVRRLDNLFSCLAGHELKHTDGGLERVTPEPEPKPVARKARKGNSP